MRHRHQLRMLLVRILVKSLALLKIIKIKCFPCFLRLLPAKQELVQGNRTDWLLESLSCSMDDFIQSRQFDKAVPFHDPFKRLNLKTFTVTM